MLVLTRSVNESVLIGKDIRVTVTGVLAGRVRLGFEAPRDVPIVREEIKGRDKDGPIQRRR